MLASTLVGPPIAEVLHVERYLGSLAGGFIGASLCSAAQGLRTRKATLAGGAALWLVLAKANSAAVDGLVHLARHVAQRWTALILVAFSWLIGQPHSLASMRSAAHARGRPGLVAFLTYLAFNAGYWVFLLHASEDFVAVEVYSQNQQVQRMSVGRFLITFARWSVAQSVVRWLRECIASIMHNQEAPSPRTLLRDVLNDAVGPFAQICVAFVVQRRGRVRHRHCMSMSDLNPSERPLRSADAYRILGLRPGASPGEVRKAYRRMALKLHPDKHVGEGKRARRAAEREFLRVQMAHQLLTERSGGAESR